MRVLKGHPKSTCTEGALADSADFKEIVSYVTQMIGQNALRLISLQNQCIEFLSFMLLDAIILLMQCAAMCLTWRNIEHWVRLARTRMCGMTECDT